MGMKRRSKASAEFSMSSMTDIIFLLLIFFMLTSSLVAPNALNLKLPTTNKQAKQVDPEDIPEIGITSDGQYRIDGRKASLGDVATTLQRIGSKSKRVIAIAPATKAPVEAVVPIMDLALKYNLDAILATDL